MSLAITESYLASGDALDLEGHHDHPQALVSLGVYYVEQLLGFTIDILREEPRLIPDGLPHEDGG